MNASRKGPKVSNGPAKHLQPRTKVKDKAASKSPASPATPKVAAK